MSIANHSSRELGAWCRCVLHRVPSLALRLNVLALMSMGIAFAVEPRIQRRAERPEWEIRFADNLDLAEYARQLDFFKIEIGATAKSGRTEYIREVTRTKPPKHVGQLDDDDRVRVKWLRGTLHAADRKLLAKAGINSQSKELWHFLPPDVRATLDQLERDYAGLSPGEVRRTCYLVRAKQRAAGYEFVVIEQDPPQPDAAKSGAQNSPEPVSSERERP